MTMSLVGYTKSWNLSNLFCVIDKKFFKLNLGAYTRNPLLFGTFGEIYYKHRSFESRFSFYKSQSYPNIF